MYSGLKVLSERSAMVTTALDYIGDILKHIKPSLVSKNQEGIQLAYWAVGRCKVYQFQTHHRIYCVYSPRLGEKLLELRMRVQHSFLCDQAAL